MEEVILDAIQQRLPGGVDDVFADADGAEEAVGGAEFDDDSDFGGGGLSGVDDADFVIDEAEGIEGGEVLGEGAAEGVVEGVHRAVAFGGGVDFAVLHGEGEGGFGGGGVFAGAVDGDAVVVEVKESAVFTDLFANDEFEGGFGGFELEAFGFEAGDFVEDFLLGGAVGFDVEFFADLGGDVGDAGEFGDEDAAGVADGFGGDVFVGFGEFVDGVDVHAAFVGEGGGADVGLAVDEVEVGDFVDVAAGFGEVGEGFAAVAEAFVAHFQAEVGDDGGEVDVAAAFADAVHGALDVGGAGADGGEGVGGGDAGVVVGVDADGGTGANAGFGELDEFGDAFGEGAAVGVAEADENRAGLGGDFEGFEAVILVGGGAVEEVLGVVEDGATEAFKISDGVGDHVEVFLEGDAKHFGGVQIPGFADDDDVLGFGVAEGVEAHVVLRFDAFAAGHAEGDEFGVLEFEGGFGFVKKSGVLWIGQRVAAFDEIDAEFIEFAGDEEFVLDGEGDAFALGAVAEGGVVYFDAVHVIL